MSRSEELAGSAEERLPRYLHAADGRDADAARLPKSIVAKH
jgi:hypothetical protein